MPPVPGSDALSAAAEPVRRQLQSILHDAEFKALPRLGALLRHVVERKLEGREAEIKESTIGVEVFGRPASYDTRVDSVVRTEARRLREKLAHYYLYRGKDDPVLIEIPKGSYVPVFRPLRDAGEAGASPAPAPPRQWRRVALAMGALAAAAAVLVGWNVLPTRPAVSAHSRVLAVLPFASLDESGGQTRYLSEGITEDLERDFSRAAGLALHAHPAGWTASGHEPDYPALARRLGADVLLTGAVSPAAGGREVRATLIRGADGSILWTDHFPLANVSLVAEREIEEGASRALGVPLPVLRRPPENPQAHDLYLQGRSLWAIRSRESIERAIGLYQQALAIDPHYALAYMGIADAYALMASNGQTPLQPGLKAGEEAANKAIALDPGLAEAHAALGLLKTLDGDPAGGEAEYQRAIALNPSYDRTYARLGTMRFVQGDFAGAERLIRQAETLNPYSQALPMIRAELYYYERRYRDALDLSHKVQLVDPGNKVAPRVEARALRALGRPEEALRTVLQVVDLKSGKASEKLEAAPYLYLTGRRAEALAIFDAAVKNRGRDFVDALALATAFASIGDRERTLEWLEKAQAEHAADMGSVRWEPAFDFVRTEPRYQAVIGGRGSR